MSISKSIPSIFEARCKDAKWLTYAVYDKSAGEFVDGTEDTNLETVNKYADQLNQEEGDKQRSLPK